MKDFADRAFDMIESLQKRIAELEAELKETIASSDRVCDSYAAENQRFHNALTAERQRREDAEAALRLWMLDEVQDARAEKARVAYFVRYASEGKE